MASYSDGLEHESNPKRIKLDDRAADEGTSCGGGEFSTFFKCSGGRSDPSEVVSTDCDSGYEASTMESFSIPSHPSAENENSMLTPSHPDTSQDSIDPDVDDDSASTVSELSGLSDLSSQEWNPMNGSFTWIQKQMNSGMDPRTVLIDLGIEMNQIPDYVDDITLWKLIINMLAEPPRRHKLKHVNTLHDVVRLMKGAKKIIVLTGAGVSVSCGIPDFRSRDGIYSRLAIDFPDLPDPQAMFDISYFSQDPRPFFKFARDIYPGKFQPSPCHRFIRLLERSGKLLRNYTQNIDTLEKEAEIEKVIECHGSFATATCTKCGYKVTADAIRETVLAQNIPVCDRCRPDIGSAIPISALTDREPEELKELVASGVMKPDIVFFGEGLPDSFHDAMSSDKNECDLLVVIGSSLKVRPVALIPSSLPSHVPQILINREPLPHCHFDVELLGDCDVIINHLCHMLGETWKENASDPEMLKEAAHLLPWKEFEEPENSSRSEIFTSYCDHENTNHAELIKERRHMSVDSARDSGIGENSNFADVDVETSPAERRRPYEDDHNSFLSNSELEIPCSVLEGNKNDSEPGCSSFSSKIDKSDDECIDNNDSINDYWQPREKRCITERLPDNSFYFMQPNRYIFPGAELFCDPNDKSGNYQNIKYDIQRLSKFNTKL